MNLSQNEAAFVAGVIAGIEDKIKTIVKREVKSATVDIGYELVQRDLDFIAQRIEKKFGLQCEAELLNLTRSINGTLREEALRIIVPMIDRWERKALKAKNRPKRRRKTKHVGRRDASDYA